MLKLKPCPFCGGEASTLKGYQDFGEGDKNFFVFILCHDCGNMSKVCEREQEAIEAWNKRYEKTCTMTYNEEFSGDEIYPTVAYTCSECKHITEEGKPLYCPSCGAKVVDK